MTRNVTLTVDSNIAFQGIPKGVGSLIEYIYNLFPYYRGWDIRQYLPMICIMIIVMLPAFVIISIGVIWRVFTSKRYMSKIGLRSKRSITSEDAWRRINKNSGRFLMVLGGLIIVADGVSFFAFRNASVEELSMAIIFMFVADTILTVVSVLFCNALS